MKSNAMMHKSRVFVIKSTVALLIMAITYCAFKPARGTDDKMTAKKALIAAVEYFPEKDYKAIENYEISVAEGADEWNVSFVQIKPARVPGGHLIIVVPKGMGEIRLMKGE